MSRVVFTLLLGCSLCAIGCVEKPAPPPPPPKPVAAPAGPVFRLHFAGLGHLATNAGTAKLNALLNSPEAVAARKQAHDRLARTLPETIFGADPARTNRGALLRPLLDDLAASKFLFEANDERATTWLLTVFLDADQRAKWSTNLWQAAGSPPVPLPSVTQGGIAWGAKAGSSHLLTVAAFDDCLMIARSAAGAPPPAAISGRHPALSTNLVDLTADLPRLQAALGLPKSVAWPHCSISVAAKGGTLRNEATLKFASPTPWKLDPFRLPTNSVRDPLISFTAMQGFGDWLTKQPGFKEWELKSAPNQLFTWARSDVPYNLLAAAPMPEASNTVARAAPHALQTLSTNLQAAGLGRIIYTNAPPDIGWIGMPILIPFVRPAPEPGDDFLLFGSMRGVIPKGPNTNPPPAELLNQVLPRTNLVYYDWEITEAKLGQWLPTLQLMSMLSMNPAVVANGPGHRWLTNAAPRLGNTITEATAVSPTEVRAVRSSDIGLTAIELTLLARWLDNPAFPAFAYPTNMMPGLPPAPGAPTVKTK